MAIGATTRRYVTSSLLSGSVRMSQQLGELTIGWHPLTLKYMLSLPAPSCSGLPKNYTRSCSVSFIIHCPFFAAGHIYKPERETKIKKTRLLSNSILSKSWNFYVVERSGMPQPQIEGSKLLRKPFATCQENH